MADSKARLLAKLLDASGDVVSSGLDNVPASDDASALTTGTLPAARIASGAITNVKLGTDISADKITTGTLPAARIASGAITDAKLATGISASKLTGLKTVGGASVVGTGDITVDTVTKSATVPASPSAGDQWFNTSGSAVSDIAAGALAVYSGSVWAQASNLVAPFSATGGTITTSGGYKYHTFTSSSTFTPSKTGTVEYLIVGGGSGAARAPNIHTGGGGAGGAIDGSATVSATPYTIVIGAGGASFSSGDGGGYSGANTTFNSLTAIGGGLPGYYSGNVGIPAAGNYYSATSGGSGGGASWNGSNNTTYGVGTSGQGNRGGGISPGNNYIGNGGGGKGAVGADCTASLGGAGGVGINWKSLGDYYAGGGGGSPNGVGGNGGGGAGASAYTGTNGSVNTGGGAGGHGTSGYGTYPSHPSASGGSGVVIIRYAV